MSDQSNFTGYLCWQKERVPQVINREAVQTERAAFLATHTPIRYIKVERAEEALNSPSDDGVFEMLQNRVERDQHTFTVLKGIPGTGKSHLIRWLKERFSTQFPQDELVLLIRRDNSSLSSALKQILAYDVFSDAGFNEQRRRLEAAAGTLTSQAVTNQLLNNLQEAARAVKAGETEAPIGTKPVLRQYMPDFLLSPDLRAYFEGANGAATRIAAFLSGIGRSTSSRGEEMPGFVAEDFNFEDKLTQRLEMSDSEAIRKLSQNMMASESFRESTANYLNGLLNRAVGRLTSISVDELKQMFGALRRELRTQGRRLALFIEDITAFTGLDEALVDVLATQHTGENDDLCRLISVVGITDGYYKGHFPDNMKQRVTYLLSLNDDENSALTLSDEPTAADMAARYLNAIRLSGERLAAWESKGAEPDQLPNMCPGCQHRIACHSAFGSVALESGAEVGLYPFNAHAIWTMVNRLPEPERTPRGLISTVLGYVLQSHTQDIPHKQFPPAPARILGADFSPPGLALPQQSQIIKQQTASPDDAARFESVVMFWGDRTLSAGNLNGVPTVSGLTEQVYTAFGLPFIYQVAARAMVTIKEEVALQSAPSISTLSSRLAPPKATSPALLGLEKLHVEIQQWRAGKPLTKYNTLINWLANYAQATVQWEFYDIPKTVVEDRIRQARIAVDGQSGKVNPNLYITLERSDVLEYALHAAADFDANPNLTGNQKAAHLTALSIWLREVEPVLVAFARQPHPDVKALPIERVNLLTIDMLLISGLFGGLSISLDSAKNRLMRMLELSAKQSNKVKFNTAPQSEQGRSKEWTALSTTIGKNVPVIRDTWLESLNCPQGVSSDVIFIDAATALKALGTVSSTWSKDGTLRDLGVPMAETNPVEIIIYQTLQSRLMSVVDAEWGEIEGLRAQLTSILGDQSAEEVFIALKAFHQLTQTEPYPFTPFPTLGEYPANRLVSSLNLLQTDEAPPLARLMRASGVLNAKTEVKRYAEMLHDMSEKLQKTIEREKGSPKTEQEQVIDIKIDQIQSQLGDLSNQITDWVNQSTGDEA